MSAASSGSRQPILDVVKAFAIWMVVLGHSEAIRLDHPGWYRAIYLVHMPLFLIATGMVTPVMRDAGRLFDRVRALMQPFLLAWLVFLPLAWHRRGGDWSELLGGLLWMNGYGLYNQPTWYLGVVSCCLALLWAWDRWPAVPWSKALLAASVALVGLWVVPMGRREWPWMPGVSASSVGWPWGLDLALLIVPLMLLGRRLRAWSDRLGEDPLLAAMAFGLGASLFAIAFGQGAFLDLNARLLHRPAWCLMATLSGCLAVWGAAGLLCALLHGRMREGLAAVGRSTLFILLFHAPLQNGLARLVSMIGVDPTLGALVLSLLVVVGLWWVDARLVVRVPLLHALLRPVPARPR